MPEPTTEPRDHTLYYGAILNGVTDPDTGLVADNFFIAQGAFALRPASLTYFYSTWTSPENFNDWKRSLQEFKKIYFRVGDDFTAFKAQSTAFAGQTLNHGQIVVGIIETCRALCGAPAEAEFVHCIISPENFEMNLKFYLDGQSYPFEQNRATYNQTIQANLQIVGAAALMGHALAGMLEPDFWAAANWVLPAEE